MRASVRARGPVRGAIFGTPSPVVAMSRPALVLLGLAGLALLVAAAVAVLQPRIEADLAGRVTTALAVSGAGGASAALSGRDVTLSGTVASEPDRVRAVAAAGRVRGVRTVRDRLGVVDRPVRQATGGVPDSTAADSDAAGTDSAAAQAGLDQVAASPDAARDAAVRQAEAALRISLSDGRIEFETATHRITPESRALLDRAAAVFLRFPAVAADVRGHTDDEGDTRTNRRLSTRRAEATRDYLVSKGVDAARLAPRGLGAAEPVGDNATEAGRARNRRVVFSLRTP